MTSVLILTNHQTDSEQILDLRKNWSVECVIYPPADLKTLWGSVPPERESVDDFVFPVLSWLNSVYSPGDLVWVQGEWGATVSVLNWCKTYDCRAIYSTTKRVATEVKNLNGVFLTHVFKHVRFRLYPALK